MHGQRAGAPAHCLRTAGMLQLVLCYCTLTAHLPCPDGTLHLQDAEHKLAMGPIENVIQGFGQCCGFPIQVLLHGTCTVP